jgi:purine-nucleoside phosphorylase
MQSPTIYQKLKDATDLVRSRSSITPKIGMILGSGLGHIADLLEEKTVIHYRDIPHFHGTSVEGHAGQMMLGRFEGVPVVILSGRFHLYEGYPMETVAFPTRVVCALGIQTLLVTNAAGGVNTRYRACDLMIIEDHLNLMGDNPLKGPHLAELGPRFPDLTEAYNRACIRILKETAQSLEIPIHQGVYAGLLGPTYETPAEVRMLRTLGADAVGMSTVPETIAANHLGVRVAGISCITNLAAGISSQKLTHDEVIENSKNASDSMKRLLRAAVPKIAALSP